MVKPRKERVGGRGKGPEKQRRRTRRKTVRRR